MNLPRGTQIIPHDISKRMADGSGGGRVEVVARVEQDGSIVQTIERVSGDVSARVMKSGLESYDRQLPGRVKQINRDPRRK